jgi:thioredoxin-related protein
MKKLLGSLTGVAFLLALLPTALSAKSIDWQTNYAEARQEASKEGKPMVLFFTGSDWCPWCIKIHKEVLSKSDFADRVADKFIFVEIDRPMKTKLPEAQQRQNQELIQQYKVKAFPTVLVVNDQGKVIAEPQYTGKETPSQYADQLLKSSR